MVFLLEDEPDQVQTEQQSAFDKLRTKLKATDTPQIQRQKITLPSLGLDQGDVAKLVEKALTSSGCKVSLVGASGAAPLCNPTTSGNTGVDTDHGFSTNFAGEDDRKLSKKKTLEKACMMPPNSSHGSRRRRDALYGSSTHGKRRVRSTSSTVPRSNSDTSALGDGVNSAESCTQKLRSKSVDCKYQDRRAASRRKKSGENDLNSNKGRVASRRNFFEKNISKAASARNLGSSSCHRKSIEPRPRSRSKSRERKESMPSRAASSRHLGSSHDRRPRSRSKSQERRSSQERKSSSKSREGKRKQHASASPSPSHPPRRKSSSSTNPSRSSSNASSRAVSRRNLTAADNRRRSQSGGPLDRSSRHGDSSSRRRSRSGGPLDSSNSRSSRHGQEEEPRVEEVESSSRRLRSGGSLDSRNRRGSKQEQTLSSRRQSRNDEPRGSSHKDDSDRKKEHDKQTNVHEDDQWDDDAMPSLRTIEGPLSGRDLREEMRNNSSERDTDDSHHRKAVPTINLSSHCAKHNKMALELSSHSKCSKSITSHDTSGTKSTYEESFSNDEEGFINLKKTADKHPSTPQNDSRGNVALSAPNSAPTLSRYSKANVSDRAKLSCLLPVWKLREQQRLSLTPRSASVGNIKNTADLPPALPRRGSTGTATQVTSPGAYVMSKRSLAYKKHATKERRASILDSLDSFVDSAHIMETPGRGKSTRYLVIDLGDAN